MHAAILAARQEGSSAAVPGMVSETSDEELLARIRAGRGDALAALIERYRRPLFGYLCRMLGDEAEADDVFQETFLRVVKNVERFETGRPVRPWLYAIAGNLVKNVYRSRAVRDHVPLDGAQDDDAPRPLSARLASLGELPEDAASREEAAARERDAVGKLPERGRAALVLFYFQGLRYEEVAAALDVPLGTVKSRIHNALARLAEILGAAQPVEREKSP
jgi:RNA polymerase sigma-70 factor (ECF subfamily)